MISNEKEKATYHWPIDGAPPLSGLNQVIFEKSLNNFWYNFITAICNFGVEIRNEWNL